MVRHAFLQSCPSKQNQGSLDPGHQTEHLQHTEAAATTTSGETNGLNQHEGDTPASNTNTLSGTVLQSAVDTTEVALMRCSMASNFSFGDGVLDTPDPKGSAAFEGGTLPGRQTSTEAPTCQDATMSIAHMSNSTSLQAVSNQERLTDIQGGCGACQGCDVGHDGCSGDLHLMQNSRSNGVALAEHGLQQSGVGTDQENLQRYFRLAVAVGFPGSGGSLDESCTFFNFVYCFFCLAIILWCEGHVCDNGRLDIDICIFKIL